MWIYFRSTQHSHPFCSIDPGPLFIPTFLCICMAERSLLKKELQGLRWHLHWCWVALTSVYPCSLNVEYRERYQFICVCDCEIAFYNEPGSRLSTEEMVIHERYRSHLQRWSDIAANKWSTEKYGIGVT